MASLYPGAPRGVTRSAVSRGPLPAYLQPSPTYKPVGPYNPAAYARGGAPAQVSSGTQWLGRTFPAGRTATLPGPSQTATQVANQQVNQQIDPQLAAQNTFNTGQNTAIKQFANALLGKLQPIAGQVGQDYNQAIQQTGALSNQAAKYLSAANPTGEVANLLSSENAPPEQQAQLKAQLGQTFGGGAGVLAFTQGTVPGSQLATDKAAAQSQARSYPLIAALKGQQDLASALQTQSVARQKLEATKPALYQKAMQNIRTNQAARAKLGETQYEFSVKEGDKAAAAAVPKVYSSGGGLYSVDPKTQAVTEIHAPAAKAGSAPKVDVNFSRSTGKLTYIGADGQPHYFVDAKGGKIPYVPPSSGSTPTKHYTTVSDATGTYVVDEDTGARRRVGGPSSSFTPSAPSPHYTTVSDRTGTYVVNEDTGAKRRVAGPSSSFSPSNSAPTVHNGRQWDPVSKTWVRAPGLPATTSTSAHPLTAPESVKFTKSATQIATNARNGGTDPKGNYTPPVGRDQAIQEMKIAGLLRDPRTAKIAMQAINQAYGPAPRTSTVKSGGSFGVQATATP
jgi:hypothetical protein